MQVFCRLESVFERSGGTHQHRVHVTGQVPDLVPEDTMWREQRVDLPHPDGLTDSLLEGTLGIGFLQQVQLIRHPRRNQHRLPLTAHHRDFLQVRLNLFRRHDLLLESLIDVLGHTQCPIE